MRFVTSLTLCALFALTACGGGDGPEARIRATIDGLAEAAEAGEIAPFGDAIADDYADLRTYDRRTVLLTLRGIMLRSSDRLLVFADTESVTLITDDLAEASVRVRFAGADLGRFALETSVYRFVLTFERDGRDWKIVSARWAEGDGDPR